jgi:hypothetical protein
MADQRSSIERVASMNLEGLILPESAPVSYWWVWLIVSLLIAVIAIAWIKKYRSPKATALRTLKQLQKDVSNSGLAEKKMQNVKKQIARSLRQGFSETRLDKVMPDNLKWREYLSTLETALYANKASGPQALSRLIKSAQIWLKNSS